MPKITPTDIKIAAERANGETMQKIANKNGCDVSTISRKLQKPEIKALVERVQSQVVEETAQTVADNLIHLIRNYKSQSCESKASEIEKAHGFKATERIAEAIGILPSHTPSIIINRLNQQNVSISADVLDILAGKREAIQLPDLGLDSHDAQIIDDDSDSKCNDIK